MCLKNVTSSLFSALAIQFISTSLSSLSANQQFLEGRYDVIMYMLLTLAIICLPGTRNLSISLTSLHLALYWQPINHACNIQLSITDFSAIAECNDRCLVVATTAGCGTFYSPKISISFCFHQMFCKFSKVRGT